ncbi:MAG TPA: FG-GAP-like repeat-containing protein [Candidatus Acidoferrales bacterium]|nr:FG-GAP-like repeat-containing protein [Candidatus Acidoferrales bacterium]
MWRFAILAIAGWLAAASGFAQSSPSQTLPAAASAQAENPSADGPKPDKSRARNAFQQGRRAEQAGDWKAEFAAYSEAATYDPSNRQYSMLREHARFQVVQSLVDNAERQEIAGNNPGARALLLEALQIDPNYIVARERLQEITPTEQEAEAAKGPRLAGLPRLVLKPGTQSFNFRGTTRGAYQEIGNQFGVKMIFDGDLPDRSVRFTVPNLDFDTAVKILAQETRTFTRVVDEHTLFVTEDTPQKVRDYTIEVQKELLLPASVTADEMNETVRMIREMTGITRTQLNTASRTLTVRSSEQNVALAQKLLEQIEQPHGELMLEIEILEVDRTNATQLGITPPTASSVFALTVPEIRQLQAAQNSGSLIQTLQSIFGSSSVSSATGSALPALIAFGGGKTIFLATMPGASANFGTTLSTVRSAQRVLLRAQDGKPATFFVGDRYPIDLGLLSDSLTSNSAALTQALLGGGVALPRNDYDTGKGPISVAIATFNTNSGHLDLAIANQTDGTITILPGNGDGTFVAAATTCTPPSCIGLPSVTTGPTTTAASPSSIVTGDFNDDGFPDIAVTDEANNRVLVLLGNGDGTFKTPVPYPTGAKPVALVAQDFDGDGQADLAVVNQTDGTVTILVGNKVNGTQNGTFGTPPAHPAALPVGGTPSSIVTGEFDTVNNSFADLVVTNSTDNTVSVLLGNGDGTFTTQNVFATGIGPAGVATSDFNGDTKADLAVTNQADSTVSILLGNGDGTFLTQTTFATGSSPVGIVAANFTGSSPDLVVADETANNADVLIGNGDGTFNTPISLPTGNSPIALATADLNGDSTLDLVTANNASNTVSVTLNTLASSLSNSGSSQVGYPSAQYEDLGLKVKATPRLHGDDEVTLQLQFDIKSLTGSSINGIPILSNRNIEQTIRLRENETSVLSGILQSNKIRTSSGLPWISTEPGIGLLTGEDTTNDQESELLILVTPRALRAPPHEVPAVYAGRGEPSSAPSAGPSAPQVPVGVPQPGQPGAVNPNQPPQPGPPQQGRPIFNPGEQPGQVPPQQQQQQNPDQQQQRQFPQQQ